MYPNEILFTNKFLSELLMKGVDTIPFKTEKYRQGVRAMKSYYELHEEALDERVKDIRLLFVCSGEKDFASAIMAVNGDEISLRNPTLERATIQMSRERAQITVDDQELHISDEFMDEITDAFCEAAFD